MGQRFFNVKETALLVREGIPSLFFFFLQNKFCWSVTESSKACFIIATVNYENSMFLLLHGDHLATQL